MHTSPEYLIGIDGGGTKTLARIVDQQGRLLAEHSAAGSALRNGPEKAWAAVLSSIEGAFASIGLGMPSCSRLAVGIGVAGYNVAQWAEDFQAHAPGFHTLRLATDASTTLLGAHQGRPGAVIAIGTGTIGVALYADGSQRVVDGWGFPTGDDGSGAWIGLRAIRHVQHALDGRAAAAALSAAIVAFCASERNSDSTAAPLPASRRTPHQIVLDWLSQANQAAFARLARLVVSHASADPAASAILHAAAAEIVLIATALDPAQQLPLALCGGLAATLQPYFPPALQQRIVPAQGDAAAGALQLLQAPRFSSE